MTKLQLFVVCLGGEVDGSHVEMHDIRFVVGETIVDTYPKLREEWIGTPESIHIDTYMALKYVDGFEIELKNTPDVSERRLYFVNTGAYSPASLYELHEIGFYVTTSPQEAKQRALESLLEGKAIKHKDDLYDIDNCITLDKVSDMHIYLNPTAKIQKFKPDWFGYNTDVRK